MFDQHDRVKELIKLPLPVLEGLTEHPLHGLENTPYGRAMTVFYRNSR
jgi:hypothetical protein